MAVLSQGEKDRVARWIQRDSNLGQVTFTKPDLIAAIADLDTFLENNATAINTALPQPFRGAATQAQKAMLLCYVVLRRYGGSVTAMGSD